MFVQISVQKLAFLTTKFGNRKGRNGKGSAVKMQK